MKILVQNKRLSKLAGRNFRAAARWPRLASLVGLFALLWLAAPPARAQVSPVQELASRLAASISAAHQKSVIVFDFVGPGDKFTALGTDLADQFSAALVQSATTFSVADRKEILDTLQKKHYELQALLQMDLALPLAHYLDVQSVVFGQISVQDDNLIVLVQAYRTDDGRRIEGLRVSMPLTAEMKKLSAVQTEAENPMRNYPQNGRDGYSYASCLHCPNPQYPPGAVHQQIVGTVSLQAVIEADGRPSTILVLKGLPDGLTEAAIAAVQTWRFKPATGPDGKPAAVVMPIEVTFRIR